MNELVYLALFMAIDGCITIAICAFIVMLFRFIKKTGAGDSTSILVTGVLAFLLKTVLVMAVA